MDVAVSHSGVVAGLDRRTRLSQILKLLWGKSWLIVLCGIVASAGAFGFSKSRPAHFSSSTTIAIEAQTFAIPELQGVIRAEIPNDPMPLVRTEMQALLSRQLVQSVITELALDHLSEFNPALRPPSLFQKAKQYVTRALPWIPLWSVPLEDTAEAVQNEVLRALVVSQDNRSLVIGVGFTAEDPKLAADFVNDLVANYVTLRAQRQARANKSANTEMLQRVDEVRTELSRLEAQIRDLRTKGELVDLRAGSIGQQQLEDLASAVSRASLERAQREAQWQRATALAQQGASADLSDVLNSPTIAKLREQESQASQHLADLETQHGPDYPDVRSATANLRSVHSQILGEAARIISSLSAQLTVARAREADAQGQLQAARVAGVQSQNARAELTDLQQEIVSQRALYQTLLQSAQRTVAQQPSPASTLDVQVLSLAVPAAFPSSPNTKLATMMGGLSGSVIGLLLALTRMRAGDAVSVAQHLAFTTSLPVAALLPARRGRQTVLSRVRAEPAGKEAEAIRLLRSRLRTGARAGALRSVLFTTVGGAKDTADIAAAFAYVAAGDGERVILAEGNLHKPCLALSLGLSLPSLLRASKQQAGLLQVLEGRVAWRDVLLQDPQAKLDLLVTQQASPTATAMLNGTRFQNLLMDLHRTYDLIVLAAPDAANADASTLAAETGATVLIVRSEQAQWSAIQEAASRLLALARSRVMLALIMPRA